jgi:hypothetical protein
MIYSDMTFEDLKSWTKAVNNLAPNAIYRLNKKTGLVWESNDIPQPTDSEITAEVTRLQAEYDSNQYQRDRATDYPAIADQLDAIFHNGIDGWKATIQLTKDKYPKEVI